MPLFFMQDDEESLFIKATNIAEALEKRKAHLIELYDEDYTEEDPIVITLVANDDEIVL